MFEGHSLALRNKPARWLLCCPPVPLPSRRSLEAIEAREGRGRERVTGCPRWANRERVCMQLATASSFSTPTRGLWSTTVAGMHTAQQTAAPRKKESRRGLLPPSPSAAQLFLRGAGPKSGVPKSPFACVGRARVPLRARVPQGTTVGGQGTTGADRRAKRERERERQPGSEARRRAG